MSARTWFGTSIAVAGVLAACSGGGAQGQGSTTGADGGSAGTGGSAPLDGGTGGTAADGGDAAPLYPAPHGTYPVVVSGGTTMTTPKVVNVSFAGDPLEADIDAFATAMGKTTYWGDVVKEYGIGPLTPTARIHSTFAPPASFSDTDIQTWLVSQLDGTHPEFPAPDANTVYALYFPPGVTIDYNGLGDSCTAFHGYHSDTSLADGTPVVYSIISRCDSIPEAPQATGIQYVSAVASHEVIEAITDPQVQSNTPGYYETDNNHIVWSFLGLAELGDLCSLIGAAFYTPPDFPYLVQRIFSNATAPTGHDPCIPVPAGEVYFNTAPVLTDKVSFNYGGYAGTTKGVQVAVGDTKTVELDLFSDGPTAGPWKVEVVDAGQTNLDLSLDHDSGQNGDKLQLTIHVKSKNTTFGAEIFIVKSTLGAQSSIWVGMVGN
jgi:hypothetical protein